MKTNLFKNFVMQVALTLTTFLAVSTTFAGQDLGRWGNVFLSGKPLDIQTLNIANGDYYFADLSGSSSSGSPEYPIAYFRLLKRPYLPELIGGTGFCRYYQRQCVGLLLEEMRNNSAPIQQDGAETITYEYRNGTLYKQIYRKLDGSHIIVKLIKVSGNSVVSYALIDLSRHLIQGP